MAKRSHRLLLALAFCGAAAGGFLGGRLSVGTPGDEAGKPVASVASPAEERSAAEAPDSSEGTAAGKADAGEDERDTGGGERGSARERQPAKDSPGPAELDSSTLAPMMTAFEARQASQHERRLMERARAAFHSGQERLAAQLLLPVAQTGVPEAQLRVGVLLAQPGTGYRNPTLAWAWLVLAERNGAHDARVVMDRLAQELSRKSRLMGRDILNL